MKRVIIDFKKLTPQVLTLLNETFPDGYNDGDVITFKNHKNEVVDAVEVRNEDTVFLVKIGKHLMDAMAKFDLDEDYSYINDTQQQEDIPEDVKRTMREDKVMDDGEE